MRNMLKPLFAISLSTLLLSGCATLDNAMSVVDDTINGASDVASGDLRAIAGVKQATLGEIWKEWQANEVAAQKKCSSQKLAVPGVVTRVTSSGGALGGNQFVVFFKDPKNAKCVGSATTRDALMVNEKRVSALKTGGKVTVSGVLANTASMWSSNTCSFVFEKSKIQKQV